jgi:hypothetical protein
MSRTFGRKIREKINRTSVTVCMVSELTHREIPRKPQTIGDDNSGQRIFRLLEGFVSIVPKTMFTTPSNSPAVMIAMSDCSSGELLGSSGPLASRLYCHLPLTLRRNAWPEGVLVQPPSIVRRGQNGGRHFSQTGSPLVGFGGDIFSSV